MTRDDARGPDVASLDGDALIAGEGRGDYCTLDGVGTASSGASLGELGAWIIRATVLGLRGLLEVDQLAGGEGSSLGWWMGTLVVDVGGRDGATAEELLLDLVADHRRDGDGTCLRQVERRRVDGLGCHLQRLLAVLRLE